MDEHQQLRSVAALLAANPKLNPTAAIRSIGVEDPAAVRRLRNRFRIEQARLMADARRSRPASRSVAGRPLAPNPQPLPAAVEVGTAPAPARVITPADHAPLPRCASPATAVVEGWCDLGFSTLAAAFEVQSVLAQFWLAMPAVSMATRGQLALGSIAVAVHKRCKARPHYAR